MQASDEILKKMILAGTYIFRSSYLIEGDGLDSDICKDDNDNDAIRPSRMTMVPTAKPTACWRAAK